MTYIGSGCVSDLNSGLGGNVVNFGVRQLPIFNQLKLGG